MRETELHDYQSHGKHKGLDRNNKAGVNGNRTKGDKKITGDNRIGEEIRVRMGLE